MNISEYEYLWTTEKNDWVLVNTSFGYGIVNKTEQMVLEVSDEELEQALIEKMLSNGCKVYNNIKDAYNDVPGGAMFGEDVVLCEKCGHEIDYHHEESGCGMTCPNCGWGRATTYIDSINLDESEYHVILVSNENSLSNIKMVSETAKCNYIEAKKLINNAPVEVFHGQAVEVKTIKEKLEAADVKFEIEPKFPY